MPAKGYREHLRLEPGPGTSRARHLTHIPLVFVPRPLALGVGVTPLQPRHHTLETRVIRTLPPILVAVAHVHLILGTMQNRLLRLGRQLFPRRTHLEALLVAERFQQAN